MESLKKLWARHGVALSEPGTWRGFVMILTSLGVGLDPSKQEAIIVAGLAITGLINVFFKDDSNPSSGMGEPVSRDLSGIVKDTRK